jgi:hypothetical protein
VLGDDLQRIGVDQHDAGLCQSHETTLRIAPEEHVHGCCATPDERGERLRMEFHHEPRPHDRALRTFVWLRLHRVREPEDRITEDDGRLEARDRPLLRAELSARVERLPHACKERIRHAVRAGAHDRIDADARGRRDPVVLRVHELRRILAAPPHREEPPVRRRCKRIEPLR